MLRSHIVITVCILFFITISVRIRDYHCITLALLLPMDPYSMASVQFIPRALLLTLRSLASSKTSRIINLVILMIQDEVAHFRPSLHSSAANYTIKVDGTRVCYYHGLSRTTIHYYVMWGKDFHGCPGLVGKGCRKWSSGW